MTERVSSGAVNRAPQCDHLQFDVEQTLAAVEDPTVAEHLRRLEADTELRDRLMWQEYRGPEWERFQDILIEYAYPIIKAWVMSGAIVEQLRRKKLSGVWTLHEAAKDSETAHDLAVDTVVYAVKNFRDKVLVPGKWRPSKGASLRTFFVGRCLIDFPNQYNKWKARMSRPSPETKQQPEQLVIEHHPERRLLHDERLAALLDVDVRTREILTLKAMRWTHEEIAEVLDITAKAVERRVARYKERNSRA